MKITDQQITRVNHIFQILALLLAGFWAVSVYWLNSVPRMRINFIGELELESEWIQSIERCNYTINAEVTNQSSISHTIENAEFFASFVPLPRIPNEGEFQIVDYNPNLDELQELSSNRSGVSPLIGEYPPGSKSADGLEIVTAQMPDQVLFVQLVLTFDEDNIAYAYDWIWSCISE